MTIKYCAICGKPFNHPAHKYWRDIKSYPLCDDCCKDEVLSQYTPCRSCQKPIKIGYNICRKCNAKKDKTERMDYGFKPEPLFVNKNGSRDDLKTTYFGVEFEFSYVDEDKIVRLLRDEMNNDYLYYKHDGSVRNGVEIVTAPMDYSSIRKLTPKIVASAVNSATLSAADLRQNTGVHIHVNREAVSVVDLYKLNLLLNYKDKDISRLYYLSGRANDFEHNTFRYCSSGCKTSIKELANKGSDRYVILNEQNIKTIEFRLFNGTEKIEEAMSYLEITKLMMEFCHNVPLRLITINNFLIYLLKYAKDEFTITRAKEALGGRKIKAIENYNIVGRIRGLINKYGEDNIVKVINSIDKYGDEDHYKTQRDVIHDTYTCEEGNLFIDYMYRRLEEAGCV